MSDSLIEIQGFSRLDVDKKINLNAGVVIVLILSFIPMFGWLVGYQFNDTELWRAVALSLAKIGAFGGMAMFALSLILSGRYKWYDKLFGGLDKMYITHRFLGTFSLLLLLIHPISLSLLSLEGGLGASAALWFKVSDFGVWLGAISLYLLIGLILWSVFARAKYETFVKVHRTLGAIFILGAVHAFMSSSILASNSFMYWYMLTLTALGSFTFLTYSLFGDMFHRPYKYELVKKKSYAGGIVELELAPKHRILNFVPGQFLYVQFDELESHGYHPFSISSTKRSSNLKLAIRKTGDFTNELANMKKGATVQVKGPYGGFALQLNANKKQLWIAGGIGVTPFLSGAKSLRHSRRNAGGDIEMIYACAEGSPYGVDELLVIEERNDIFNVTVLDEKTFGFINFETLVGQIKDIPDREIFICGPPAMLTNLRSQAEKMGFGHRLHYEEFTY